METLRIDFDEINKQLYSHKCDGCDYESEEVKGYDCGDEDIYYCDDCAKEHGLL